MSDASPLSRYLVPLKRWWYVLLACVLGGLAIAWVTLPAPAGDPTAEEIADPDITFRATYLLIRNQASPEPLNFDLVQLLARQDEITNRVLDRMGGQVVTRDIDDLTIETDPSIGTVSITTTQSSPHVAAELVTVFAAELQAVVDERAELALRDQADRFERQLADLTAEIARLEARIARLPDGDLDRRLAEAELDSLVQQFASVQNQRRGLTDRIANLESQLVTLQEPSPVRTDLLGEGLITLPREPLFRFSFGALLGLLIGIALALVIDRLDTRIHTRREAEEAFGLPVIAQFPHRTRRERASHPLPTVTDPAGVTSEGFRALRLAITSAPLWQLSGRAPSMNGAVGQVTPVTDREVPRTLVVSSPRMGDGKSTVVANLAASFAESGQTVLVIDCDFRRPAVAELLTGNGRGPGLRDIPDPRLTSISELVAPTAVDGVLLIRAGATGPAPPWFLTTTEAVVAQATRLADIVIFDTGPLLLTNEATALIPAVDAVVLAVRAGKVQHDDARTALEHLTLAAAPVAGIVLVGAELPRRYGYGYYTPTRGRGARRSRTPAAPGNVRIASAKGRPHRTGS